MSVRPRPRRRLLRPVLGQGVRHDRSWILSRIEPRPGRREGRGRARDPQTTGHRSRPGFRPLPRRDTRRIGVGGPTASVHRRHSQASIGTSSPHRGDRPDDPPASRRNHEGDPMTPLRKTALVAGVFWQQHRLCLGRTPRGDRRPGRHRHRRHAVPGGQAAERGHGARLRRRSHPRGRHDLHRCREPPLARTPATGPRGSGRGRHGLARHHRRVARRDLQRDVPPRTDPSHAPARSCWAP
jgi:hypothetical protein